MTLNNSMSIPPMPPRRPTGLGSNIGLFSVEQSARRARPPQSSTARASRARKKGPAIDPTGYDAGKKIKGKKRHILVDKQGLLMHAIVHAADVQDRDGGALVMASLFGAFPFLIKLYADGGYPGPEFQSAMKRILAHVNVEIVKRSDQATGFLALPKRAPSPGSAAADDWPRTGNASTTRRSPSCASPPSASCCESYPIPHDVLGQTSEEFSIKAAGGDRCEKSSFSTSGNGRGLLRAGQYDRPGFGRGDGT